MHDYYFYLDGKSSLDFGVRLQAPLSFQRPSRKFESVPVPGRSGALHIVQNAFEDVKANANCFVLGGEKAVDAAVAWLFRSGGQRRIETPEDPLHYRTGCVLSGFDVEVRMNRLGVFGAAFDCTPQRYLKSGEQPTRLTAPGVLRNPEHFAALPIITVYGNGSGLLSVGGTVVRLLSLDGFVTLDSETQNAYRRTENKNGTISAPTFPSLAPGDNEISFSGGITHIEMIPRWWTL